MPTADIHSVPSCLRCRFPVAHSRDPKTSSPTRSKSYGESRQGPGQTTLSSLQVRLHVDEISRRQPSRQRPPQASFRVPTRRRCRLSESRATRLRHGWALVQRGPRRTAPRPSNAVEQCIRRPLSAGRCSLQYRVHRACRARRCRSPNDGRIDESSSPHIEANALGHQPSRAHP